MLLLVLLFIGLPILELWLLIEVGSAIGATATVALVLLTGVAGATLARSQGVAAWSRLQSEMASGRPPTEALAEGFAILLAGLVLLTPGFVTDALGLLFLVPFTRRPLLAWMLRRLAAGRRSGSVHIHVRRTGGPPPGWRDAFPDAFPGGADGPARGTAQGPHVRRGVPPFGGPRVKDVPVVDDGRDDDDGATPAR